MNVRLHIEELVLEGFPPGDRHRIAEAVQAELARLFGTQGVPSTLPALPDMGRLRTEVGGLHPTRPERSGADIARAVYDALGGGSQGGSE